MTTEGSGRRFTRWQRLLLYLSASDLDCLRVCSAVELYHHLAVGTALLLSSGFAFAASYYAIQLIAPELVFGPCLAVLWALTIMNLDRLLVSSVGTDSDSVQEVAWLKRYVAPLVLRAPLAILLGMTIAVPLELKVFAVEIEEHLNGSRVQLIQRERAAGERELRTRHERSRSQLEEEIHGLRHRKQQQQDSSYKTLDEIQNAQAHPVFRSRTLRDANNQAVRNEAGEVVTVARAEPQPGIEELERKQHVLEAELADLSHQLDAREQALARLADELRLELEKGEALQSRKLKELEERRIGLPTRFEALQTLRHGHPSFNWLFWQVGILLVLLEVFPVLSKILTVRRVYDRALEEADRARIAALQRSSLAPVMELQSVSRAS